MAGFSIFLGKRSGGIFPVYGIEKSMKRFDRLLNLQEGIGQEIVLIIGNIIEDFFFHEEMRGKGSAFAPAFL